MTVEEDHKELNTSTMEKMPWSINVEGVIEELADRLYKTAEASCREACSNSIDSGSKKVAFEIGRDQVSMEDWGNGLDQPELLAGVAIAQKKGTGKIGEKGIGRLALLRLGKVVEFLSNNGEIGIRVIYERGKDPLKEVKRFDRFLSHKGTKVIIHQTSDLVPTVKQLLEYLGKVYAPLIMKDLEITVNGRRSLVPEKFIAKENHILTLPGYHARHEQVRGALISEPKSDGKIDVYIHGALVKEKFFVSMNQVRGWIECNILTPRTDRDDIVEDKAFALFKEYICNHVKRNFARIDDIESKSSMQVKKRIKDLFKTFMKDAHLLLPRILGDKSQRAVIELGTGLQSGVGGQAGSKVPGFELTGNGGRTFDGPGGDQPVTSTISEKGQNKTMVGRNPKNNTKNSTNDPQIVEHKGDPDGLPVQVILASVPTIVINVNSPITKVCYMEKAVLGSKFMRMIPFLAKAFHDAVRENRGEHLKDISPELYMQEVYRVTVWLYKAEGLL